MEGIHTFASSSSPYSWPIDETESDEESENISKNNNVNVEESQNENMEEEKEAKAVSVNSDVTDDSSTNSADEFDIDEYSDIVPPTQPAVTESQLSTHWVFDSQETHIPGSLSWLISYHPCKFIVVFV